MTRLPTFSQVLENDASIRLVAGISLLTVAVSLLLSRTLGARRRGSLPPGPPGYPIVGNLFDIPTDDKWKVYAQMARDLGSDIISLRLPIGPSLIILNSAACADALFVKRSAIYSDRPRMVVLQELVQAGWNLAIMPYGETFKAARKVWHKHIDVPFCRPHAVMAVNRLLQELLPCKKDHDKLIRLATGRFILSSGYGIQAENSEDPFVSLSERWIKTISHATQRGGFLVDSFPILKIVPSWFPGAGFQKKAQDMKKLTEEADGTAIRSYASRYLESSKEEQTPEETDAVCSIIGNMYLAGADTTELTLRSFILAMALHPEIQKKGQEAVDKALGGTRMPTLSDFGTIPYVDAIINETLRWKPAVTVTIPHGALQDDVYGDYFIPKGSIVIANIAAILSDEKAYGARTDEFRPERFMMPDGLLNKSMNSNPAFGYGRRQCTGMAMSRELTWMTVASVLCSIDVGRAVGADGKLLNPATVEYLPSGSLNYPPPFDCTFTPRSETARHWIEEASNHVHY
ncbi:cytochrome P450 [Lentinula edodes]|uniref:cytochrome P450 n=1 Tax=Lentinula edodes TaxID=5353 RepID=UPI001E8D9379|nr:cytochrome P450 [Lentinula edodes]KAH7874485.1 cytochrome P450 [Lentinula edodes]